MVFLLTSFESAAQEIFSNIIPPPSGSAGLGAMTNISTNNYSGTANINIPLINIIEKEYPLDISLSYNTTGRKVAEVPSWVGLGWNLNAGGLITRTVMSMPDDYNEDGNRKWKSLSGIEFPIRKGKGYQYVGSSIIDNTLIGTGNDDSKIANIKNKIYGDGMDTEPDIFYFNFNGHSGKFVMNQDKKIYLLPGYNSDLSIQYINSNGIYFLLTDSDQTKYYFNTTEISHITNQAFVNETISCIEYTSSWYLSQIVTKSGTSIDFTYDKSMIDVSDITPSYFGTSLFTSQSHYYTNIYQELLFIESIK